MQVSFPNLIFGGIFYQLNRYHQTSYFEVNRRPLWMRNLYLEKAGPSISTSAAVVLAYTTNTNEVGLKVQAAEPEKGVS